MDKRLKELNNKIAVLRQSYGQYERTSEELLAQARERFGGDDEYLCFLASVAGKKGAPMEARFASCFAQFGIIRLLLNEAEREYDDILLGIE